MPYTSTAFERKVQLFSLVIFCFCPSLTFTQMTPGGGDQCRDVLKQTTISRTDTFSQQLAYLRSIQTEAEFNDAKSGGGSLDALVDLVPVEAKSDFSMFTRWRNSYLEEVQFKMNLDEAHRLITSFIPTAAYPAWLECMQVQADAGGLKVSVEKLTPDRLTVRIQWDAPRSVSPVPTVHLPAPRVLGGILETPPLGLPATTRDATKIFLPTYTRRKNEEFRLTMAFGNASYVISVPPEPKPPAYRTRCVISLQGGEAGADALVSHFSGVPENYPPTIWTTPVCSGFRPFAKVHAEADIKFAFSPPGGTRASVAPYLITPLLETTNSWEKGSTMAFDSSSRAEQTGLLTSTVDSATGPTGTVYVGIYVGVARDGDTRRTLDATPGSKITITQ